MINENVCEILVKYFHLTKTCLDRTSNLLIIVFRASFVINIKVPVKGSSVGSTVAFDA